MTTGFVRPVLEQDATFEQFVWSCASAFDFLARRNDTRDVDIDAVADDSHERKRLDEAQSELESFRVFDAQGRLEFLKHERAYIRELLKRASAENAAKDAKIDAMAERVLAWEVPNVDPLPALRNFMLSQLQTSKCLPFSDESPEPTAADVDKHLEMLERRVARCREEVEQIAVNYGRRQAWIEALLASVPKPEAEEP